MDVIVGFPGETQEHFLETYQFLNELNVSYFHVFTYSERDNTEAVSMPNSVPVVERKRRNKMLRILSAKKQRLFYESQKGKDLAVIFENENKNGCMFGFTQNYVKVKSPWNDNLCNKQINVRVQNIDEEGNMDCLLNLEEAHQLN